MSIPVHSGKGTHPSVSEDEGSDNLPDFENRPFTEPLCNTEITEELITKAIDKLKPTKAQGPDNISIPS